MYLLDAIVFIEASRTYSSATIAPTYWAWLADQHAAGNIASIAAVRTEIDDGNAGHLKTWAAGLPATFWIAPTQPSITAMTTLTAWTMDPARTYSAAARQTFLQEADYYLTAEALGPFLTPSTCPNPSPASSKPCPSNDATAPPSTCRTPGCSPAAMPAPT